MTSKRIPADTSLDVLTFLNDKKINSELYAILQSLSRPVKRPDGGYDTVVNRKDLPKQTVLCEKLGIKSPKTYRSHFNYLKEKGYVEEDGDNYILPEMEDIFFMIPLDTLQYLNDNCKEHIIKIYVYLGQRFKFAQKNNRFYEFSSEELGEHIGLSVKNHRAGYEVINNALRFLHNTGLIEYCEFYDGKMQRKRLVGFSFKVVDKEVKQLNG